MITLPSKHKRAQSLEVAQVLALGSVTCTLASYSAGSGGQESVRRGDPALKSRCISTRCWLVFPIPCLYQPLATAAFASQSWLKLAS